MKILVAGGSGVMGRFLIPVLAARGHEVYVMTRQRGASNAKAKETLGWELKYPSWRQGFAAEFGKLE